MGKYLDKPIIFIGFPRSGTTIISEIIMQHHKLAWVSNYQDKFSKTPYINLVRNFFQNRFWNIWGQKNQLNEVPLLNKYLFKPGEAYSFWNYLTGRNFAESFLYGIKENSKKRNEIRSFLKKLVYFQNRERLSFKITGPARLTYLYSVFPDALFIRIKRKPLPTLRSLLKVGFWNEKSGRSELWWNQNGIYNNIEKEYIEKVKYDEPALLAALQYYKVNKIYNKEQELCGANIFEIKYEDFITWPTDSISEILTFLGMELDKGIKSYLSTNEIYNRNKRKEYFIAPDLDPKILAMVADGVKGLV